jgi:hypothetical protein
MYKTKLFVGFQWPKVKDNSHNNNNNNNKLPDLYLVPVSSQKYRRMIKSRLLPDLTKSS